MKTACLAGALLTLITALPALGQEPTPLSSPPPAAEPTAVAVPAMSERDMWTAYLAAASPGKEHSGLASQAGSYDTATKTWMAPGAPALESKGKAERKALLGNRVLTETFKGEMAGRPFEGSGSIGFDNVARLYWSTWIDSMSTALMSGTGSCDDAGACSYEMMTTDAITRKTKVLRVATRWTSPTQQIFEMFDRAPDGQEWRTLEIVYTKRK